MAITVNLRYTGENGNARRFAEEMTVLGTVEAIRLLRGEEMEESISEQDTSAAESGETDQKDSRTGNPCCIFDIDDPKEAYEHMDYEILKDYGSGEHGHYLFTWDDGNRMLARCKRCGGYILIQSSEFHSMSDGDDSYYTDWFPVGSPTEAEWLNQKYDGFAIESKFLGRYLMRTNGSLKWSRLRSDSDKNKLRNEID